MAAATAAAFHEVRVAALLFAIAGLLLLKVKFSRRKRKREAPR
jgi:hypothetical protein